MVLDAGTLVALVTALAGSTAVGGLISSWFQRRKMAAETSKTGAEAIAVLSQTATALVMPLQDQIERLYEDLREANDQIDKLSSNLRKANAKIYELEYQVEVMSNRLNQANKSLQDAGLDPF